MAAFTNSIHIERTPAEVFAYLADFENLPEWNYAITKTTKLTPGPVHVGTEYRQTRSMPTEAAESFTVTAYEPDAQLAVAGRMGPFTARVRYRLQADGNGTLLINDVELDGLVARLAAPRVRKAVAANLDVLRRMLDRAR
jgi:hypothetical protein